MTIIQGWDAAEDAAKKATGGLFVKLENDGDKVVLAFIGEPFAKEVYWNGTGYEDFTPELAKQGKSPSYKFKLNAYVIADRTMKVYECSSSTFKDVLVVKKKYGLATKCFEITRSGKKGDTKTTYSILPERDLTPEELAHMATLPLNDLTKNGDDGDAAPTTGGDGFTTFGGGKPDDAIAAKEAEALTQRLKVRPRAEIDRFLTRYGVQKIKEVKNKDLAHAQAFVSFLEGKGPDPDAKPAQPAPAATAAKNDPFA